MAKISQELFDVAFRNLVITFCIVQEKIRRRVLFAGHPAMFRLINTSVMKGFNSKFLKVW